MNSYTTSKSFARPLPYAEANPLAQAASALPAHSATRFSAPASEPAKDAKKPPNAKISWVSIGFFGAFHALALLAPWFFSWSALGVAILLHWLCGSIGICMGYHRMLTHRSFQVPQWLEYIIATIGA
ncbi:MAG: hypothetical protein WBC73_23030, partial [Phormidesmis sp.]